MEKFTNPREIRYERYEFHAHENTVHTGTLLTLVYDIPYFYACGVFPPMHIANQIFLRGTAGGGMSPGTKWEPFTLSEDEYTDLAEAVRRTPVSEINPYARYAFLPMKFDHRFDNISEWEGWFAAACKEHRDAWHADLRKAGAIS